MRQISLNSRGNDFNTYYKAESASPNVRKSPIRVGGQMSFGKPGGPLACTASAVNSLIALPGITGEEELLRYTQRVSITMHRRLD
jgi:hypothetical protein